MPFTSTPHLGRDFTGAAMYHIVYAYHDDLGPLAALPLERFFARVSAIPYADDATVLPHIKEFYPVRPDDFDFTKPLNRQSELLARPKYSLYARALDCKKKSILFGCWALENKIPFRFVAVKWKPYERIHHVFTQMEIDGRWQNVDATFPEQKLFQGQHLLDDGEVLVNTMYTMSGTGKINPSKLNNFDAGLLFLAQRAKENPGISLRDAILGHPKEHAARGLSGGFNAVVNPTATALAQQKIKTENGQTFILKNGVWEPTTKNSAFSAVSSTLSAATHVALNAVQNVPVVGSLVTAGRGAADAVTVVSEALKKDTPVAASNIIAPNIPADEAQGIIEKLGKEWKAANDKAAALTGLKYALPVFLVALAVGGGVAWHKHNKAHA